MIDFQLRFLQQINIVFAYFAAWDGLFYMTESLHLRPALMSRVKISDIWRPRQLRLNFTLDQHQLPINELTD